MKSGRINKADLKSHLKESAKKLGFRIRPHLFVCGSNEINARTPTCFRIIFISKGALEKLDKEEQFAILDHEFGHIKRWKEDTALLFYLILPLLSIMSLFIGLKYMYWGIPLYSSILFLFLFLILRFFKLDYLIDLKIKSEFGADRISAELGNAKTLISALKKADKEQSYSRGLNFIFRFYFSNRRIYPSTDERIKKLEKFL